MKNAILLIGAVIVNVCARTEKDQVQGSPFTRRRRRHAPLQVLCFNYSPVAWLIACSEVTYPHG